MDNIENQHQTIKVEYRDKVALVTLNRPECLNAVNVEMIDELTRAVDSINNHAQIKVAILTGAGRAFCAGGDLKSLADYDMIYLIEKLLKPLLNSIADSSKPWISAVDGAAAGIGSSFAMACDLTVMSDKAYIYQAFSAIGLVPDGGASWHLTQTLGRKRAFEAIALGKKITAEDCLILGLCNRVVPVTDVLHESIDIANKLAKRVSLSLNYSKKLVNYSTNNTLADVITREGTYQQLCYNNDEAQELIADFINKESS